MHPRSYTAADADVKPQFNITDQGGFQPRPFTLRSAYRDGLPQTIHYEPGRD